MRKIVSEFSIGTYKVLKLDGPVPAMAHTKYLIGGIGYKIVPVYDLPNCIAVTASAPLVGKEVDFI